MDAQRRVIRDGAVAVRGDRIVAVGKATEVQREYRASHTLGGPRHFVTPGFIDCHNHVAQALVRDYALEDYPNICRVYIPAEWVQSADDVRVSAKIVFAQLLRSGATTICETPATTAHIDPIAETALEVGMRCALARGQITREARLAGNYEQMYQKSSYRDDPVALRDELAETEEFLVRWTEKGRGLVRPWVHCFGVGAASEDHYLAGLELATKYGTGLQSHVNRDREEIELSFSLFGERPIEHLHRIGALAENFVAIHAMLTTDREIMHLAGAKAKLAHAPIVCTDILSAITKVVTMRAAGVTVGLGCDTVINDLFKVMRHAYVMHGQATAIPLYDPLSFTTEDAFEMATIDAARVLLWEDEIGSLEVGKAADVTVVNGNNVRLFPAYNPIGTLVRYGVGTDTESVLAAGRLVVDGGRLLTIDEEELLEEAAELSERIAKELAPRRYHPLTTRARIE